MPPASGSPSVDRSTTETSSEQSMQDVVPSALTAATSTEESSESRSRPRVNSGDGSGSASLNAGRKRKTPASITQNACTTCKKARAKCNGGVPACKRCTDRNIESQCHYEVHAKTAKEEMVREIKRLQQQTETLVKELASLGEENKWIEQIMHSLKQNGHGPEILARLKMGESHEAIAKWLQQPDVGAFQPQSPTTDRKFNEAIEQIHRNFAENPNPLYWTNVARKPALVDHLIKLYLTWIHPVHMLFDQDRFTHSFLTSSDEYCSAPMVNVICAMACHLLHDSHGSDAAAQASIADLRTRFMEEAKYYLQNDLEYTRMTTIQTHAIMFLVDLSNGHGQMAASYLRLAVESLLATTSGEAIREAEEITFWGILTLHTAWSGFTYQKPSAPVSLSVRPLENLVKRQSFDSHWHSYTTDREGSDEQDERQSHALETASEHAKLFRIVHRNILTYCGSQGRVDAPQLLKIYERYLAWKEELPHDIADLSGEPLPHALCLHINYHTVLVHLLQPLLHLQGYDKASYEALCQLLLYHARTGLQLLYQYQTTYSQYFLTPLQNFCMVHICEAYTRYNLADTQSPSVSDTIIFCIDALEQTRISYPIAGPLQQMFRSSLRERGISLPDELEHRNKISATRYTSDELLDACTRPTYRLPTSQINSNMEPHLGHNFITMWDELTKDMSDDNQKGKQKATKQMNIDNMLNK